MPSATCRLTRVDTGWQRVATAVTARRVRRGYRTAGAFASATGLSTTTIDKVEHARQNSYDPATIAIIEQALGWRDGSIDRIRHGMQPELEDDTETTDPDLTRVLDAWSHLTPEMRRLLGLLADEASHQH